MKKAALVTVIIVGVLSIAGIIGWSYISQPKPLPKSPPPDWKLLDIKVWDETFYKLIPEPTEDGNAFDSILKATHNRFSGIEESKPMGYDWWDKINTGIFESDKPEDIAVIEKAIKIPELDLIVAGSSNKDYQWLGVHVQYSSDPEVSVFMEKIPYFIDVRKLGLLLVARAEHKLTQSDLAGAEADMLAVASMGHILQKDITMIGLMVGLSLELYAAEKLPDLYRKLGNEVKAKAWEDYIPECTKRKDSIKQFFQYGQGAETEELMKLADNSSLPKAIRVESMMLLLVNTLLSNAVNTFIWGVPEEIVDFLAAKRFDDPEMVIIQSRILQDIRSGPLSTLQGRYKLLKGEQLLF